MKKTSFLSKLLTRALVYASAGFCVSIGFYFGSKVPVYVEYLATREARDMAERASSGPVAFNLVEASHVFAKLTTKAIPTWEDVISPAYTELFTQRHVAFVGAILLVFSGALIGFQIVKKRKRRVEKIWQPQSQKSSKILEMSLVLPASITSFLLAFAMSALCIYLLSDRFGKMVAFKGIHFFVLVVSPVIGIVSPIVVGAYWAKRTWNTRTPMRIRCAKCGYDLRASVSSACPECGLVAENDSGLRLWIGYEKLARRLTIAIALLIVFAVGAFALDYRGMRTIGKLYGQAIADRLREKTPLPPPIYYLPLDHRLELEFATGVITYEVWQSAVDAFTVEASWRPLNGVEVREKVLVLKGNRYHRGDLPENLMLSTVQAAPRMSLYWFDTTDYPSKRAKQAETLTGYGSLYVPYYELQPPPLKASVRKRE